MKTEFFNAVAKKLEDDLFKSRSVPACACCLRTIERFVCTCCEFFLTLPLKKLRNDLFKSRSVPACACFEKKSL